MDNRPDNPALARRGIGNLAKRAYVGTMLALVPLLVNIGAKASRSIAQETAQTPEGFSFALVIEGTGQACACRHVGSGWKRLPSESSESVDYAIRFRDVDYAFSVFSGSLSLKDALAARLFSTKGPNSLGVALTYLFTTLLRTFFFWRAAYRGQDR